MWPQNSLLQRNWITHSAGMVGASLALSKSTGGYNRAVRMDGPFLFVVCCLCGGLWILFPHNPWRCFDEARLCCCPVYSGGSDGVQA